MNQPVRPSGAPDCNGIGPPVKGCGCAFCRYEDARGYHETPLYEPPAELEEPAKA